LLSKCLTAGDGDRDTLREPRMRSLGQKLLLSILPLCLIPLVGISIFSYFQARERITEDRIALFLEQIARDISDSIKLTLLEKTEEMISTSLYAEFRDSLKFSRSTEAAQQLLDVLVEIHEVYDVLVLFDRDGSIRLCSGLDRNRVAVRLDAAKLRWLQGQALSRFTPDSAWLSQIRSGRFAYLGWHRSELVHALYRYEDEDAATHYVVGFAAPIHDEQGEVVGGILALMNWVFIQEILDKVEEDLRQLSLNSGYAFLLNDDHNTIIGHQSRPNRRDQPADAGTRGPEAAGVYGRRLREDLRLDGLQQAISRGERNSRYAYPPGTPRISGLASINHEYFHWVCGVGVDEQEFFAPVQALRQVLILAASVTALLVAALTYSLAQKITVPLKKLTESVGIVAAGDYSRRVAADSRDEIGELARTFNEMARSLEERGQAVAELNRSLEEKVRQRTRELERSHEETHRAYRELQDAQVQLVQSEKMASLGQLVSGIAHEIKNPLNFIYGNTEFLKQYIQNLKHLVRLCESRLPPEGDSRESVRSAKESMNFEFMVKDLDTLILNFEEGAKRIHAIIGDLKTFSRLDREEFSLVNIREPINLALNLLQHEFRDRVRIHRELADTPPVNCHPGKMSQVFLNLLANASQAIVAEGDIWVRSFCRDGKVIVEVEDNGVGIDEGNLRKIFEPFFTTKPAGQGTGLGLSITYGIIQQHQGTIEVESRKGEGTLFRIFLPARV
jgi:signal transduction histidine kinase